MSRFIAAAFALALCLPYAAQAQSESASVGFFGLIFTPVGAFTPVVTGKLNAGTRSTGLQLRASRWQFGEGDDETMNLGAGLVLARGKTRTTLEVGYVMNQQCDDCGIIMAGADVQYDLTQSTGSSATFAAVLNPALGLGIPTEGDAAVITVGLSVPLSASINAGSSLRIVPFISPGVGVSLITGTGDSETGYRAMMAGGVSLGGQSSPVVVSVSARKIFLEQAPTIYGIGVSFAR